SPLVSRSHARRGNEKANPGRAGGALRSGWAAPAGSWPPGQPPPAPPAVSGGRGSAPPSRVRPLPGGGAFRPPRIPGPWSVPFLVSAFRLQVCRLAVILVVGHVEPDQRRVLRRNGLGLGDAQATGGLVNAVADLVEPEPLLLRVLDGFKARQF